MMKPAAIHSSALEDLSEAMLAIVSEEWSVRISKAPFAEQVRAAVLLNELQKARLALGNALLDDIAEKLKANEEALLEGRRELRSALERVENVTKLLNGVAGMVGVVAKIVPI